MELRCQLLQFIEKYLVFSTIYYENLPIPLKAIKGMLSKIVSALIGTNVITEVISEEFFYHLVAPVFLHADFYFLEDLDQGSEDPGKLLEFWDDFVTTILHVLYLFCVCFCVQSYQVIKTLKFAVDLLCVIVDL